MSNTNPIAELNDRFRRQLMMPLFFEPSIIPGKVVITAGVNAIPAVDRMEVLFEVRNFNDFTPDNDPYGERDFGSFEYKGQRIFWKIDYYAPDMQHGSEDPADPKKTVRVLTIMLADEY
jgi:hypothetical protein